MGLKRQGSAGIAVCVEGAPVMRALAIGEINHYLTKLEREI